MGIGIDGEKAAGIDGLAQKPVRGILALGARVDLDGLAQASRGFEDSRSVELRLGAVLALAAGHAAGAVAEDVQVRVFERPQHARGHLVGGHAELRVDTRDDDVETGEELGALVEASIGQDVGLDAGEHTKGGELGVEGFDFGELFLKARSGEAVGHLEPRRVVGEHHVIVTKLAHGRCHVADGRGPVGPVGVHMTVATEGGCQGAVRDGRSILRFEGSQAVRDPAIEGFGDHRGGRWPEAGQVTQAVLGNELTELGPGQDGDRSRGLAEGTATLRGAVAPFEQEGDALEGMDGVHGHSIEDPHRPEASVRDASGARRVACTPIKTNHPGGEGPMATPDELRTQLESARAEFRKALEVAGSGWEQQPAGGEGEEAWSPRQVAEHAIGTETYFATSICKSCGYPGVEPIETNFPTANDALQAFDAAVEACNKKLKHVSAEDLAHTHERMGSVENIFQINITHMQDHAQQIRNAVGATA